MNRRLLLALLIATSTLVSLLVATPANAAGIPGTALPCADVAPALTPEDRGGWGVRSFVAEYPSTVTEDETRPRSVKVGEPCAKDGTWQIPVQTGELSLGTVDPEDPQWEGSPGATGPCTDTVVSGSPNYTAYDWNDFPRDCSEPVAYVTTVGNSGVPAQTPFSMPGVTFGTPTLSNSNRTLSVTFTGTFPSTGFGTTGVLSLLFRALCENNTTGAFTSTSATSIAWTSSTAASVSKTASVTCGSGTSVIAGVQHSLNVASQTHFGVFYRPDGDTVPNSPGTVLGYRSSYSVLGKADALGSGGGTAGGFVCSLTKDGAQTTIPLTVTTVHTGQGEKTVSTVFPVPKVTGEAISWQYSEFVEFAPAATTAACPYLYAVYISFCSATPIEDPDSVFPGVAELACINTEWLYDTFQNYPQYGDDDTDTAVCTALGQWDTPLCDPINYPGYQNYAEYDTACPNPPEPAWLDFSWIPATIGYHARCLFFPQGGFDAHDEVNEAWLDSPPGEIGETVVTVFDAFDYAQSCGVILSMGDPVPMELDTCEWGWAAPLRDVLAIGLWVLFGLWALSFLLRTVLGFQNRKTPNPLAEEGGEG